ncbi:MAG: hypothetical protein ACRCXA_03085, partial [Peptostreptococcaceae bacterium]
MTDENMNNQSTSAGANQSSFNQQNPYTQNQYSQGYQGGYDYSQYGQNQYSQGYQGGYDYSQYGQNQYSQGYQGGYDYSQYSQNQYSQGYQGGVDYSQYGQNQYTQGYQGGADYNNQSSQNPLRVNVTPNNPATSSNNITLNLDSLYEKLNEKANERVEIIDYNETLKKILMLLLSSKVYMNVYSFIGNDMPIGTGEVSVINNNTVSIGNKVIALSYISYISFHIDSIQQEIIYEYFNKEIYKGINNNFQNDFYYI